MATTEAATSETEMLDAALRSAASLSLTEEQVGELRSASMDLHVALIDSAAEMTKAELRRDLGQVDDSGSANVIEGALTNAAAARVRAHVRLRRTLTGDQLRQLHAAAEADPTSMDALDLQIGRAIAERLKDQKAVEIETASLVAERLISWAKLFAWAVAMPAALLVAILAVFGISKYSDFSSLVADSEGKLKATIEEATEHADTLRQKVASIADRQAATEKSVGSLSNEINAVKEKLGFAPDAGIDDETQLKLQESFKEFQAYLIGLGYVASETELSVRLIKDTNLAGTVAYYSDGTIFVAKPDPQLVYREYLHHVLYSFAGIGGTGPQRSAMESGLADYLVASYADNPALYEGAFGVPRTIAGEKPFVDAVDQGDRFPVGEVWAAMLWDLRQALGQAVLDRAIFAAWRDQTNGPDDESAPVRLVDSLLQYLDAEGEGARAQATRILEQRGFPVPGAR